MSPICLILPIWSQRKLKPLLYKGSLLDKFGLFLSSASRYSALAMGLDEDDTKPAAAVKIEARPSPPRIPRRKIILLEDLPNVNHLPTRSSFHQALDAFLRQSDDQNIPLVLIFSENVPRLDEWGGEVSGNSYKDRNDATLTIRSLVPTTIRRNPGFVNIE